MGSLGISPFPAMAAESMMDNLGNYRPNERMIWFHTARRGCVMAMVGSGIV